MTNPSKVWVEWCEAARRIEDEFGNEEALSDLESAGMHPGSRAEVPAFVAGVRRIFEPWQLAEYLDAARQTEPFDPSVFDEGEGPDEIEAARQEDIGRLARDLLPVERARWVAAGR